VWVGDDAIDPLEQAQTLQILVGAGIKTREEARADLGLAPAAGKPPVADNASKALRKFNRHHDERGQFATADGAVAVVGSVARKPQRTPVQVASNDAMMSDVMPTIDPEEPPPFPESRETVPPGQGEAASLGSGISDGETRDGATRAGTSTVVYPDGWQECHEKCLVETEGVWPPSDRPGWYRRCVRECLGPAADDYWQR
jgi:hypothetical protein